MEFLLYKDILGELIEGGNRDTAERAPKGPYLPGTYTMDLDDDGSNEILRIDSKKMDSTQSKISVFIESKNKQYQVCTVTVDGIYTTDYDISALDVNGDGKLELIVLQKDHNISASVYEFKNEKVTKVLGYYNGD